MVRVRQFLALTGLTALEAIRQPICLLLATACVVAATVTSLVVLHTFKNSGGELARDSALAYHLILGLFITGYAACTSLSREVRRGTASVVLSRPVDRGLFFLSKFAGVILVLLLFSGCATIAALLAERIAEKYYHAEHLNAWIQDVRTALSVLAAPVLAFSVAGWMNFRWRRPFVSSAFVLLFVFLLVALFISGWFDVAGRFTSTYDLGVNGGVLAAGCLVTAALGVLTAIALALSTRLTMAPTLAVCVIVLILGLLSDYIFGRAAADAWPAALMYAVIPNWQHFWVTDALRTGGGIPAAYMGQALLYAGLYAGGVLIAGMVSFYRVEVD